MLLCAGRKSIIIVAIIEVKRGRGLPYQSPLSLSLSPHSPLSPPLSLLSLSLSLSLVHVPSLPLALCRRQSYYCKSAPGVKRRGTEFAVQNFMLDILTCSRRALEEQGRGD